MRVLFNANQFAKEMNNIVNYSIGFLEGAARGKAILLRNLGEGTIEVLKQYIDSNARVSPEMLKHMYEWDQAGSPTARLFDINYTVSNLGLSFNSTFRQSTHIKSGSTVPFYDKAKIMEEGIPVTIRPKSSRVLVFDADGEQVFTPNPVNVDSPGGRESTGGFESAMNNFFNQYFRQSFMNASGLSSYLSNPSIFKKNLTNGKRMGKSAGLSTGYTWIANAKVGL